MVTQILFVEGTTDETNGDLRRGFNLLLSKKIKNRMPRITTAKDTDTVLRKFKTIDNSFALIDLDGQHINDNKDIEKLKKDFFNGHKIKDAQQKNIFFMVQEMEAWFLSQPDILREYYKDQNLKIPQQPPMQIANPSDVLYDITKKTKKGHYHKVKHGAELLPKLDIDKLMSDFPDFKDLLNKIL